ncbi:hypothetical protein [Helicobacter fennelliae]|uniref:hypothetical protein n=1 Tax=Helicobacter fennelliae TaxID=215 RepID=UPI001392226E|nr:hypothetical protein [Helicobacter fennelliae]
MRSKRCKRHKKSRRCRKVKDAKVGAKATLSGVFAGHLRFLCGFCSACRVFAT